MPFSILYCFYCSFEDPVSLILRRELFGTFDLNFFAFLVVAPEERFQRILDILQSLQLEKFVSTFVENEIDDQALTLLDEETIKELGLPLGARVKLLSYINDNNANSAATKPSAKLAENALPSKTARISQIDSDDDSATAVDESEDEAPTKPTQGDRDHLKSASKSSKVPEANQQSPTKRILPKSPEKKHGKTKEGSEAKPAAESPPYKPSCCSSFARGLLSTLFYIFVFPFVLLWRGLAWIATKILLPVLPSVILLPLSAPIWIFYFGELNSDIMRGTYHPIFAAVSITFLIAAPLGVVGAQIIWYLWLYHPSALGSEPNDIKQKTVKTKED
jgi:hypothetical protein